MGKYYRRKNRNVKSVLVLISLVAVLACTVTGTLAYLLVSTGAVTNQFTASEVKTAVVEQLDGMTKKDVKIQNTGDTEAYIRATVVVTWQKFDGTVYGTAPVADTDYEISYNLNEQTTPEGQWTLASDGFYYWTSPVEAGKNTGILISEAKYLANAPTGYSLCIEILGSGIQSVPTSVVTEEWESGVDRIDATDGKTLVIKTVAANG